MSLASRWQQARLNYHRSRVRQLVDNEKWTPALSAVIDFAQFATGRIDDPDIWLELTILATRIVGHLDDPAEYRAFLEHFASPVLDTGPNPRPQWLDAFSTIADHADSTVMIAIGRWLADARPQWPLGPYLIGHFTQQRGRQTATHSDYMMAAEHFSMATDRADHAALDIWRRHSQLRQGSILLSTGVDRRRGRSILGRLDWTQLFAEEQLWMALSLASSAQWTDRLRAMDIVLDLHRALQHTRPSVRHLRARDLRRSAAAIFKLAGLQLPDAENRRLEQLSDTLFDGEAHQQWKNYLQSRRRLDKVASLPFAQSDEVEPLLEKLSAVYPERWEPATRRFQVLLRGWRGDYDATASVPSRAGRDQRMPIANAVAQLCTAVEDHAIGEPTSRSTPDQTSLSQALKTLIEALSSMAPGADGGAARPVGLVWPKLLEHREQIDLQALDEELVELATLHARVAPPPSYGWWQLAAQLYATDHDSMARPIAEQARVNDRDPDPQIRSYVASKIYSQSVESRDASTARKWLDAL